MTMTHTVICRDSTAKVLEVIVTFSEKQVLVAVQTLKSSYTDSEIEIISTIDDRYIEPSGR